MCLWTLYILYWTVCIIVAIAGFLEEDGRVRFMHCAWALAHWLWTTLVSKQYLLNFFLFLASKLENPLDYYIFPAPVSRKISPYRLNEAYYCTKNLAQCPAVRIILKMKYRLACTEHTTPTEDFPSHEPKISTQSCPRQLERKYTFQLQLHD
jgi:hypothetical protein